MCSVNFWHQQDSNSLFKGSIGHLTSHCKWSIFGFPAVGFICLSPSKISKDPDNLRAIGKKDRVLRNCKCMKNVSCLVPCGYAKFC